MSLSKAISSVEELYQAASQILRGEIRAVSPAPLRLRLMGKTPLLNTALEYIIRLILKS